jgi:hypothetical protein
MTPDPVADLLLNLKMQLLALPGLVRWGTLAVVGVILLRDAITWGWERAERRRVARGEGARALPAPDPFAGDASPPTPREEERHRRTFGR